MRWADGRLHLRVAQDGSGQFCGIQQALDAVPWDAPATLHIGAGVYREKLYCDKNDICLIGHGGVVIQNADAARHTHADGQPFGTFRSYTAFFRGNRLRVKNLCIQNTAGYGSVHGQAVAAAVETRRAVFEQVRLIGWQDTLYTGPLPDKERIPGGFTGPSQRLPRVQSSQFYDRCIIEGEVDFIFGGADALFRRCVLVCRGEGRTGYVAAPSTAPGQAGYVFYRCHILGRGAERHRFYLARPWRPHGAAAFIRCRMGRVIHPAGFDDWGDAANRATARFAECGCSGAGAHRRGSFGQALSVDAARRLLGSVWRKYHQPIDD